MIKRAMGAATWAHRAMIPPVGSMIVLALLIDISVVVANGPSMPDKHGQVVKVTDKENAGEVVVSKGNLLAVTLPSVPGTGYGWRVVEFDTKSLEFVERSQTVPGTPVPGAAEQQTFLF